MAGKQHKERTSLSVASERAVVAAVRLGDQADDAASLEELRSLAETAGASVVGEMTQRRQKPDPASYIGSGKLEELKALCDELKASLVIFDNDLSPSQIANIEEIVGRKIVDRSELILDIFASRATTHEAKLQVELAQLEYTYPRLRAMWDHLERIVGGGGLTGIGTRGPGEQQLEIDRRLVRNRLGMLRRELSGIQARKRREVQKRNQDFFTVGLVGYTNAGKSTLFNTLTAGGAYVADKLFATLMTRTREWDLGESLRVMLSDTVGFVRDLPHNLVASFRATLEEATHADLLLIVLDVSDPKAEMQFETVRKTLDELEEDVGGREEKSEDEDAPRWKPAQRLLLLNKVDKLTDRSVIALWQNKFPGALPIVAREAGGEGHAELARAVLDALRGVMVERTVVAALGNSRAVAAVERKTQVLDREYTETEARFRVRVGERQIDQLFAAGARVLPEHGGAGSVTAGAEGVGGAG
ncbi:MAG: GTPase HflX [Phycisphaerales bacterium]